MDRERTIGAGEAAGSRASPAKDWARALVATAAISQSPERTLADLVAERASESGRREALLGEGYSLTYEALAARICRYARWARACGLGRGARVALLMPNQPDYLAIWLGLTRAGVTVALLNTSLVGASLAHTVAVADASHLIVAASLRARLAEALAHARCRAEVWCHGDGDDPARRIDLAIEAFSGAPLSPGDGDRPSLSETALLIFTSGTTGLPKAARVSHRRVLEWSLWFAGLLDTGPDDRMYLCLPMYHSVGGVVATGALLARGGSVVIRERFSASRFWPDVAESGATLFQYIGELCRYLVNADPNPAEGRHRLRLCVGNGLGAPTWRAFAARFPGPRILEFYASTEGNLALYNCEGEVGAVGRVPPLLAARFPLALVRHDPVTGEPLRDAAGLCLPCAVDEPGEALGLISSDAISGGRAFEGYTAPRETARKVLHDVLAPGDRWFRTGDLMRRDARGFVRFVDRIGETFRWKGENVATGEVAAALLAVAGVADAAVYGVAVPGREGRAGMAALAVSTGFDLDALPGALARALPAYAVPVFLRLCAALPLTGTYKHSLADLKAAGFDPACSPDPIHALDRRAGRYVPLDAELDALITRGDWPA